MADNHLKEKIENYIREMPSLPVSIGKVLEICNSRNVNPSALNHVISLDPVLTGRLLHLINSAYYGLGSHVTSLVKAITMLGLNTVKNLALSTAVLGALPKNKEIKGLNMEGFWHHCLCVGVTSKLLAAKQGVDPKYLEEYFTAGLLHDIGKIPLNAALPEEYVKAVTSADRQHRPLIALENDNFGINHCTCGAMISNAWKLHGPVADVIVFHHDIGGYTGEYSQLICTVSIANYFSLVYQTGFAGDRKPVKPESNFWTAINLDESAFEDIKDKINKEIERAKIFLKVS
jgi:putative nucleotidyltransferase with HDIG domain